MSDISPDFPPRLERGYASARQYKVPIYFATIMVKIPRMTSNGNVIYEDDEMTSIQTGKCSDKLCFLLFL